MVETLEEEHRGSVVNGKEDERTSGLHMRRKSLRVKRNSPKIHRHRKEKPSLGYRIDRNLATVDYISDHVSESHSQPCLLIYLLIHRCDSKASSLESVFK